MALDEFEKKFLAAQSATDGPVDEHAFRLALDECRNHFRQLLVDARGEQLRRLEAQAGTFRKEIFLKWQNGFEELATFLYLCEEVGRTLLTSKDNQGASGWKHRALFATHARCLRVAREIEWLLLGGFADGALGRWRTLHELSVVLGLLASRDEELSRRYILHRATENHRAANVYNKFHTQTSSPPIGDEIMLQLASTAEDLKREFGSNFSKDWGWAEEVVGKERVTFADIEALQSRDLMRPNYKWASDDIHGGFNATGGTLGTDGLPTSQLLVGPSISGLLDPAHWTGLALMDATVELLRFRPTLDRIALMDLVREGAEGVRNSFYRIHIEQTAG
ncbi:MAG: hypothetical protein KKF33_11910 [Alphaproteobacteria bacterium]|nr:hypothetical protein [Alphaproteobacteria bacterium]